MYYPCAAADDYNNYTFAMTLLIVLIIAEAAVTVIQQTVQACHHTGILNKYTL